ncbi:MAG TPA: cytochrome c [Terracidiphilus sp.]|nr:cytochrome c [Terracidiphilus sp.]
MALVAILSISAAASALAENGADTYKAKCQMCHGATGMADTGAGKAMKVKPVTDPDVKSMTAAQMIAITKSGKGKMPAFQGKLTDDQIKAAVDHYLSLVK